MNEALLKKRLKEAPRTEPQDAVKLAYQSAFGCAHLLCSCKECTEQIRQELQATPTDSSLPAMTKIGSRLGRLHLASPSVHALPPCMITDMMCAAKEAVSGDFALFEQNIALLEKVTKEGFAPFDSAALTSYLDGYRKRGCPPVSHSESFRNAYHPAYRVVLEDYAALLPVIGEIQNRLNHFKRVVVVFDGCCGSGKTTLSKALCSLYQTEPIQMDDFFLPFGMRTEARLSQPGGNIHRERFVSEVLTPLLSGGSFHYQRFDCATGALLDRTHYQSPVTVIEGSYSHHPYFSTFYDRLDALKVFIKADSDEQCRRIENRDPDKLPRFRSMWIPLEKRYFEAYDIAKRADLVLQSHPWNTDENDKEACF